MAESSCIDPNCFNEFTCDDEEEGFTGVNLPYITDFNTNYSVLKKKEEFEGMPIVSFIESLVSLRMGRRHNEILADDSENFKFI